MGDGCGGVRARPDTVSVHLSVRTPTPPSYKASLSPPPSTSVFFLFRSVLSPIRPGRALRREDQGRQVRVGFPSPVVPAEGQDDYSWCLESLRVGDGFNVPIRYLGVFGVLRETHACKTFTPLTPCHSPLTPCRKTLSGFQCFVQSAVIVVKTEST